MLIESILFSFFTLELVGEQLESFQDNQTYVDDLKDLIGVPLTLVDAFRVWIGEDWWFWMVPTQPVLTINYCERLYNIKQVMNREYKKIDVVDYDPDGKMRAIVQRESRKDKFYFAAFTALYVATWYYVASN